MLYEEKENVFEEQEASEVEASYTQSSIESLMAKVRTLKLLTAEQEKELLIAHANGSKSAKLKLVTHNLRLVINIAKRYLKRPGSPLIEDLIAEGTLGLMHAIEKFDVSKGFRLTTYATPWIHQTIDRHLMNNSSLIRIPVHVERSILPIRKYIRDKDLPMTRTAIAEAVRELGLPETLIELAMDTLAIHSLTSLDAPLAIDPTLCLVDSIPDERSFEETHEDQNVTELINTWLDKLNDKQKFVLIHRFGLCGALPKTLEDIAIQLNLTRERVRQIEKLSIKSLRLYLKRNGIDDIRMYL